MWKQFLKNYLVFTKKERTGILALMAFLLFLLLLPYLYPYFVKRRVYDHTAFEKAIAALQVKQGDSALRNDATYPDRRYARRPASQGETFRGELFPFDPNTATPADWKRLGIRDKTIATIQRYLSRGGKFTRKEDLAKIWGLQEEEVKRLTPYIQLAQQANQPPKRPYEKKEYRKTGITILPVDINNGDSAAFIALPGIGAKLSQRILHFREKLGGFYRVEQVGETFGLPDSSFQKIKPYLQIGSTGWRRVNINTATVDEMKAHPYIRYALASAVFQYRARHGNFSRVEDIKQLMSVTAEVFNRLAPYLTVE